MIDPSDPKFYIYTLLKSYTPYDKDEETSLKKILEFLETNNDCFGENNAIGHITGSALVTNDTQTKVLLTHHARVDKWLQFGGHSRNDPNTIAAALKKAENECGLKSLRFDPNIGVIFDVDVHTIPDSEKGPTHSHFDIRILLMADENEHFVVPQGSKDIQWLDLDTALKYNSQHAFQRMIKKLAEKKVET